MAKRVASVSYSASYDVQRLVQLRADIESTLQRMETECVRVATRTVGDESDTYIRLSKVAADTRTWMLEELDKWITDLCQKQSGPGCN